MVGCLTGPQGFTLGWDVRPCWGRAVHRNGKKVSNGNQDVTGPAHDLCTMKTISNDNQKVSPRTVLSRKL